MWTKEEKTYLKQNYHKLDISHLSTCLKKTPAAIRQKAFVLNLTNKHERRGDAHHATKYHDEDVRERIARTVRAAMLKGKAEPVSNRDELPVSEIECDICGFKSTDPDGAHYCCEDNSDD